MIIMAHIAYVTLENCNLTCQLINFVNKEVDCIGQFLKSLGADSNQGENAFVEQASSFLDLATGAGIVE